MSSSRTTKEVMPREPHEQVAAPAPVAVVADGQASGPTTVEQGAPAHGESEGTSIPPTHASGGRTPAVADRLDQMLELLVGLSERVVRMENSQRHPGSSISTNVDMEQSVFGRIVRNELERRLRADSLEEAMGVGPNAARLRHGSPPLAPWQAPPEPPLPNTHQPVQGTHQPHHAEQAAAQPPQPAGYWPAAGVRVPTTREMKLAIQPFSGKETYKGLGSGFFQWRHRFVRQLIIAQQACRFDWPEDIKLNLLGNYLTGSAHSYYVGQLDRWCSEQQTLEHVMNRMLQAFHTPVTSDQAVRMMWEKSFLKSPQTEGFTSSR